MRQHHLKSKEAGTQTGLSEEEKDTHYKEEYNNAECELLKNIHRRNPERGWDILIGTLFKHLARENRAKRSKEEVFSKLDNLEGSEGPSIWRPLAMCLIGWKRTWSMHEDM